MTHKTNVLFVEDNEADALLMRQLFDCNKFNCNFSIVTDGDEALNYVYRKDGFSEAPRPDLILLDLNLPRVSGKEVLKRLKTDAKYREIPVIILSTSSNPKDISDAYALAANAFITKPVGLDQIDEMIRHLVQFWFRTATLSEKFSALH